MAKLNGGTVTLELTYEELVALREALKVADRYEYNELWSDLRADLDGTR